MKKVKIFLLNNRWQCQFNENVSENEYKETLFAGKVRNRVELKFKPSGLLEQIRQRYGVRMSQVEFEDHMGVLLSSVPRGEVRVDVFFNNDSFAMKIAQSEPQVVQLIEE